MSQSPGPLAEPLENEHLSFPTFYEDGAPEPPSSSTSQPRELLKDRLYVGNLHPSVDEYSLLQLFSKFGTVTKLDFLFHKTGLLKGKPRGYAFIEYGSNDDATKALTLAHDKLFRGRKLVVTFAHQAPLDTGAGSLGKRKGMSETGRPTTLSLLKSGMSSRQERTDDKIAMMEAKLRQMEATKPESIAKAASLPAPTGLAALPAKPAPPLPAHLASALPARATSRTIAQAKPLPSLPMVQPTQTPSISSTVAATSTTPAASRSTKPKLVGVKITKSKEKVTRAVDNDQTSA